MKTHNPKRQNHNPKLHSWFGQQQRPPIVTLFLVLTVLCFVVTYSSHCHLLLLLRHQKQEPDHQQQQYERLQSAAEVTTANDVLPSSTWFSTSLQQVQVQQQQKQKLLSSIRPIFDTQKQNSSETTTSPTLKQKLTRQNMLNTGSGLARSFVTSFEQKREATGGENNRFFFWCRPSNTSTGRNRRGNNVMAHSGNNNSSSSSSSSSSSTMEIETEGLFFVKTPKTASQSINRILRRIAMKVGSRVLKQNNNDTTTTTSTAAAAAAAAVGDACHMRGHHIQGDPAKWYARRHSVHSLLLTSLRDPATRALSRIYWNWSTRSATPTAATPAATPTAATPAATPTPTVNASLLTKYSRIITKERVQQALQQWTDVETGCISSGRGGFQLQYTSFSDIPKDSLWRASHPHTVMSPQQVQEHVRQVLSEYDFIFVHERLEESLVALQLLMGLQTTDILSMPLHVGGSYLYDRHIGCTQLLSPPKLPHLHHNYVSAHSDDNDDDYKQTNDAENNREIVTFLDDYFQSPTWFAQNYGDYLLLGAAHTSLDRTIAELGNERFQKALTKFQRLQQRVLEVCSKRVVFPCSSSNGSIQRDDYQLGKPTAAGDRYPQRDIEACIDEVVAEEEHNDFFTRS